MPSIRVKSIGPICDSGVLQLRTVNLFIGRQSTGKSTLLKIISHCRWVEKMLCIGRKINDRSARYAYTHYYRFVQELIKFYRFDPKFFSNASEIHYVGDTFSIELKGGVKSNARIEQIEGSTAYNVKMAFIPSERNLVSAIKDIESWYRQKDFDMLFNFIFEWDEMRERFTTTNALPLAVTPRLEYYFDKSKGEQLRMAGGKEFSPFYASSGVQSALPLEGMINAITAQVGTKANLSKTDLLDIITSIIDEGNTVSKENLETRVAKNLLTYNAAALFVEEPEQNLYPSSQSELIYSMVKAINRAQKKSAGGHSMLSVTTHSPYLLSTLNVIMAASEAYAIDPEATIRIVDSECILPPDSISA